MYLMSGGMIVRSIKVQGVTLTVKDRSILKNINVTICEGDSVAILGPNGAGKTTLINVILDLQRFKNGSIKNDFKNLPAYKIGVHMQESDLNDYFKVKEILHLFLFEGDNSELIEKYHLTDKLNQKIVTLSGGEKQKLLLILAFQNKPVISFIDEVTTGLDIESRKSIIDFIKHEMHNKTLVMVTHYLEEAEALCYKFLFMKNGEIIEYGKKEDLYRKYKIHKSVYLETISLLEIPKTLKVIEQDKKGIKFDIENEQDMIMVMNFISQHNLYIKQYSVNEPSLERLYIKIVGEGINR